MGELLAEWGATGPLGYVVVAVAAATPWLEILVVIPPAILLDLDPATVTVVAFLGNYAPVGAIVVAHDAASRWWSRRRGHPAPRRRGRGERAQRVLRRYGVPGLALLGPLVTGIHLAAVIMLATGASRQRILAWTGVSLAAWSIGLAIATVAGLAAFTG